jgi:hypothetical protein
MQCDAMLCDAMRCYAMLCDVYVEVKTGSRVTDSPDLKMPAYVVYCLGSSEDRVFQMREYCFLDASHRMFKGKGKRSMNSLLCTIVDFGEGRRSCKSCTACNINYRDVLRR